MTWTIRKRSHLLGFLHSHTVQYCHHTLCLLTCPTIQLQHCSCNCPVDMHDGFSKNPATIVLLTLIELHVSLVHKFDNDFRIPGDTKSCASPCASELYSCAVSVIPIFPLFNSYTLYMYNKYTRVPLSTIMLFQMLLTFAANLPPVGQILN